MELNDSTLPKITVNEDYVKEIEALTCGDSDKKYIFGQKNLISNEPLNSPLSDEMLVSKLQSQGINLARRTVAKYRELLNIPASSVRRRMMKIQNINFG